MSTIASSISTKHETEAPPTLLTTSTPNIIICPICCEEEADVVLSSCHHQSCGTCLVRWIDREEVSGRTSGPTCPFCRVVIRDEDVLRILDRPFQPRAETGAATEANDSDDGIDELTLHWINQNTMPCRCCGNRVERSGGCDHIECLCGHQFCYGCGGSYGSCRCVTPGDEFVSDVATLAPLRDNDGFVDLRRCIRRSEVRQERLNRLNEEREEWEHSTAFPSACTSNGRWLFSSTVNTRCITMMMHQLGHENIHYERDESREWDDIIHPIIQNAAWVFLRHGADVKAMYQLFHRDDIMDFRKGKLDKERDEHAYLEECWSYDFNWYKALRANYDRTAKLLWSAIPNGRTQEDWNDFSGELKRMENNLTFNVWYNEYATFHLDNQWGDFQSSYFEENYERLHRFECAFYHKRYRAAYDHLLRSLEIGRTIADTHLNRFSGVLERMEKVLFSDHATYDWRHHSARWLQDLEDILRFERSSCCCRHCRLAASNNSLASANDVTTKTGNKKWRGVGTRARMKLESKVSPRTVARWKRKKSLLAWSED